jgi:hypothetical protein
MYLTLLVPKKYIKYKIMDELQNPQLTFFIVTNEINGHQHQRYFWLALGNREKKYPTLFLQLVYGLTFK